MEVGGHTLPNPSAHWPPWQSSKKKQLPATSGADHVAGVVPEIVALSVSKPRVLAQHSTEETAVPTEDGPHSCSDTASWQGSFEEDRRIRHSKKPRSGRRAKSRLHNESFVDCVRSARAECNFEQAASSGANWCVTLSAVIEGMGEDMEGSHFFSHGDVDSYSGASGRHGEVNAESSEDNDEEPVQMKTNRLQNSPSRSKNLAKRSAYHLWSRAMLYPSRRCGEAVEPK